MGEAERAGAAVAQVPRVRSGRLCAQARNDAGPRARRLIDDVRIYNRAVRP